MYLTCIHSYKHSVRIIAWTITQLHPLMLYYIKLSCHYLLSLVCLTQHIRSNVVSWSGGRYTGERFAVSPVRTSSTGLYQASDRNHSNCAWDYLKSVRFKGTVVVLFVRGAAVVWYLQMILPRAQFHHSVRRTLTVSDFLCHLVVSQVLLTLLVSKPLYEIQVHLNPFLYYCLEKQHGWSQSWFLPPCSSGSQ